MTAPMESKRDDEKVAADPAAGDHEPFTSKTNSSVVHSSSETAKPLENPDDKPKGRPGDFCVSFIAIEPVSYPVLMAKKANFQARRWP